MDAMELFKKLAQCEDKEQMQRVIEEHNASQKPQTNADRIRAMCDEELAKYLIDVEQGNFTVDCCDDRFCDTQNCCHDCTGAVIKWLKQPAKEVSDG